MAHKADQLCKASAKGNLSEVMSLLQSGACVNGRNKYNRTALQVAMLGSSAVVDALLAAGADVNVRDPVLNLTVLHDAARDGYVDTVRVLLARGADANLADDNGNVPLQLAAREGHVEVVRLLIGRTGEPRDTPGLG